MAMDRVVSLILSGGRGDRLLPLTRDRAKGAVPFGGRFRLIDIPISNCLHASFGRIYVLTQFLSASIHHHLQQAYRFDGFDERFVRLLTAEQSFGHTDWSRGTADAVRWSIGHLREHQATHYLVLASDQVYRMDFRDLYRHHVSSGAEITVACVPVRRAKAAALGLLRVDAAQRITGFLEKPGQDADLREYEPPASLTAATAGSGPSRPQARQYLASMGIYLFDASALGRSLENRSYCDFGRDVLPACCRRFRMHAYLFPGFWEDVGTIRSFFQTSLRLTAPRPPVELFDPEHPIYCADDYLPPTRIESSRVERLLAGQGCLIRGAEVRNAVLGARTVVREGARLEGVVCLGNTGYESGDGEDPTIEGGNAAEPRSAGIPASGGAGRPALGIGPGTRLRRVIVDENARIGRDCRIDVDARGRPDGDYEGYSVRDGILVIHRNAVIPDGTVL